MTTEGMPEYDGIPEGSNLTAPDLPPPEADGLDRPSDVEDALDDQADAFNEDEDDGAKDDSDDESLLSEVDEAQFGDFDPTSVDIAPDFETLRSGPKIGKRKREAGDEGRTKKKERTRERARPRRGAEDDGEVGPDVMATTGRKRRTGGEDGEKKRRVHVEIDEDALAPEERRRRQLDRAMDAAVKKSAMKRARKGDIDLEQMADEEIAFIRNQMINAAMADSELVRDGKPAFQKLKMLPTVTSLLNRNTYTSAILDPETNLLEAVRFFLEPLQDGSLPAYNIQRELFASLERLPMTKEALISSGIGKVIFFYRKSKRVDQKIKRQATKLMEEWSRPILQKSDDFSKKTWNTVDFDPGRRKEAERVGGLPVAKKAALATAPGTKTNNRARMLAGVTSYSIVPQSQVIPRR